ncbi:general amidase-like protein [Lizonia empirigonia]|nr:general amidase-like protein [Lizonia empirigonia]
MSLKLYQAISNRKRNMLQSLIPTNWRLRPPSRALPLDLRPVVAESNILTPTELSITSSHDATSLSKLIRSRELTSEAVTIAFCKRAAISQQLTNCLSEILFLPAIEQARALDAEQWRKGKTRGPLHGIPISLKDTFNIKGNDSSVGMTSLAEKPAQENAALVNMLLEQGAVLYCKTNVSQTLMALDSNNHIFGRTLNPRNTLVTAGGSSGGEGALLAMRGSILGVGTDIGGSIRIPAMCNGLYSIKPSSQRIPFSGQEIGQLPGTEDVGLQASAGPIATSARDCELFLKTIANAKPWENDPRVAFGTWVSQGELGTKPLFGVLRTDGITTPLPPVAKVLDELVQTLRERGTEVVEISAPAFKYCQSLANAFFSIGGHNRTFDLLEETDEPLIPWLSTRLTRRPPMDLSQVRDLHVRKTALEKEMLGIWKDEKGRTIDALICPVAPHPVPGIDKWNCVGYTSAFVLLDYPAATLPVRDFIERDMEDEIQPGSECLGGWDRRNRELWTGNSQPVDRAIYLNTKLSVQIVAPRLQERRLYQALTYIDTLLKQTS